MTDYLLRGAAAILTGLPGAAARHPGPDLRVRAGRIEAIGALDPTAGEEVIDVSDMVIYPAWVNAHHHLFQSLMKGDPLGINQTLMPWLHAVPYRYRSVFDASLFRIAVRVGLSELALSGCGTVADHNYLYAPTLPFDTSAILFEEAERVGLRLVLCRGGQTRSRAVEQGLPAALQPETLDGYLRDIERLARRYHDPAADAMQRVVVAPTTPLHAVLPEELRLIAQEARRLGLRMHSHLSETVSYQDDAQSVHGISPVRFCAEQGWLGPDVSFAHLVHLDATEISLLGTTRTGVAHCPQSNGRLGSGIAPIIELERAGAQIAVGVDGAASNEAADMISEVHAAWLMQRARAGLATRPLAQGGRGEDGAAAVVRIEDVIRWASSSGADLFGLNGLGRLQPGQAADLAVYRLDHPRYLGLLDPAIGPVSCAGAADLRLLLVAGKAVVVDGVLAGLDQDRLAVEARQAVALIRDRVSGRVAPAS